LWVHRAEALTVLSARYSASVFLLSTTSLSRVVISPGPLVGCVLAEQRGRHGGVPHPVHQLAGRSPTLSRKVVAWWLPVWRKSWKWNETGRPAAATWATHAQISQCPANEVGVSVVVFAPISPTEHSGQRLNRVFEGRQ
jgi:hypothetical protein